MLGEQKQGEAVAKKSIKWGKFEDFEIVEGTPPAKVGTIRVKPSGLHWKPKGKQSWYGVSIEEFAEFIEQNGKQKSK